MIEQIILYPNYLESKSKKGIRIYYSVFYDVYSPDSSDSGMQSDESHSLRGGQGGSNGSDSARPVKKDGGELLVNSENVFTLSESDSDIRIHQTTNRTIQV